MNAHDDASLYELAGSELASGNPERGIFAKAFSMALGDEGTTKALYIQFRVEQLKAEALRHAEACARQHEAEAQTRSQEARRRTLGRKEYLAELKEEFGFISKASIPESSLSSERFSGSRDSLRSPVMLTDVAEALGVLEFTLIDAVKAGILRGVRGKDDEWWIEKKG